MTHYSRLSAIVLDAPEADHDRELEFWQAASGKVLEPEEGQPEYHGAYWPGHDQMILLLQRLEDGEARVHLDIRADDVEAEVARLERLGATRIQETRYWWVLRDPAGLLFCVVAAKPGSLTDANAQRWD
jgi:hypothetical protein